jgi:hypothetical protein
MHFMAIRKRKTKIKVQWDSAEVQQCSSADRVQPSINLLFLQIGASISSAIMSIARGFGN